MQQAQRDTTIKVTDQEIAEAVEQQVRKVRGNFTSRGGLPERAQEGRVRTPEEYRRWLTDQQRRAAFQNRLIDKLRQRGQAQAGGADRAGDAGVLRRAEGPASATAPRRSRSGRSSSRRRPSPEAKARAQAQADSIVLELRRGRRLRHRRRALLAGSRARKEQGGVAQLVPARA